IDYEEWDKDEFRDVFTVEIDAASASKLVRDFSTILFSEHQVTERGWWEQDEKDEDEDEKEEG
ncbi:hypothetical protein BGZ51_000697, partial [Haplosporangium sp. Z 767]